jgi:hypothetical protein
MLVALGGLGVAVPKLLLDEVQRLTLEERAGRGGVAQVMKAHRAAQPRELERLLVPLLAAPTWRHDNAQARARRRTVVALRFAAKFGVSMRVSRRGR